MDSFLFSCLRECEFHGTFVIMNLHTSDTYQRFDCEPSAWWWTDVCFTYKQEPQRVRVSIRPAPGVSIPAAPWVVRAVRQDTAAAHPAVATRAGALVERHGALIVVIISSCLWLSAEKRSWGWVGEGGEKKNSAWETEGEERRERSQCRCLGSDSSLFTVPSETCTGCPSAGSFSMQSDALSVCLTVSLSQSLFEEWVLLLAGPFGHNE